MPAPIFVSQDYRWIRASYYSVQFGKTLLWVAADLVAFYALVLVDRLSPFDVSLVLMGGLAWHALSDLAVGGVLDRTRLPADRLAMMTMAAVPIAAGGFAAAVMFARHAPLLALGMMMLSRTAYAIYDIPHHGLLGRMASLGIDPVRVVSIRNLWGYTASIGLGLGLAPWLGPRISQPDLFLILAGVALVSIATSLPIGWLLAVLRDASGPREKPSDPIVRPALHFPTIAILGIHLVATLIVATSNKWMLGMASPGIVLVELSVGRLLSTVPLTARWGGRFLEASLVGTLALLAIMVGVASLYPGPVTIVGFGLVSGWVNILAWSWVSYATDRLRLFAAMAMVTKIGLLFSIPLGANFVDDAFRVRSS